jgi:hypothetical protein
MLILPKECNGYGPQACALITTRLFRGAKGFACVLQRADSFAGNSNKTSEKGHPASFDLTLGDGACTPKEYIHRNEQAEYKQEELGSENLARRSLL